MKKAGMALLVVVATMVGLWWSQEHQPKSAASDPLLSMVSDENVAGYALATQPGAIKFPRDLGPHFDYQTEWWYYTGNLQTGDGRLFGYQLTFFRRSLTPPGNEVHGIDASSWRANNIYMAHFAVSDIANNAFYPNEKFSRNSLGLAGATAEPYRVWLEDWYARDAGNGVVQLFAQAGNIKLDLNLTQNLPPVLHGDGGLSIKSTNAGNASYYYSLVRQDTRGTVSVNGETFAVTGLSWKDHEYGTSALSSHDVGWDWFSLQFDDGTALMVCQIREADGRVSPLSSGSFVAADGRVTHLDGSDWRMDVKSRWTSRDSGATYPSGWEIEVRRLGLRLTGSALMPNQEFRGATTYWEGAVGFDGRHQETPIRGRGYVEMTGYAKPVR